jgi:pimeloyl-ACP methyl ester carboxylesterase
MVRGMLTERVLEWAQGGEYIDFRGRRIFVRRRAGEGPPLLLLHGFPTASYDFRALLDALPGRAAIAFDLLGFGLSDKPHDHDYSLLWQADLAEHVAAGEDEVVLLAHDIGTSVATELMARDVRGDLKTPIHSIVMLNGSILQDVANPTIGQRILASPAGPLFARLMSERGFRVQFGRIFSDDHPLDPDEAADQWSLIDHHHGNRVLPLTIGYMAERRRLADRWHGGFRDWRGDLSLVWGMRDPVATPAVLDRLLDLRPDTPVTRLELGHYPQIEDPQAVAEAFTRTA